MKVEVRNGFIRRVLLDEKEPLTQGVYCELKDGRGALEPASQRSCHVCAVGGVIRNLLSSRATIGAVSSIASSACCRGGRAMADLEREFEGLASEFLVWDAKNMAWHPNRAGRRYLAKTVRENFPEWVEVELDDYYLIPEQLKLSKDIRKVRITRD